VLAAGLKNRFILILSSPLNFMKFNPQLKNAIYSYFDYVIIVEGKKDKSALKALGFEKVYELHQTGVSLRERLEQISQQIDRKDKVCILTDLDKKGKDLYMKSKTILQELGAKLDSSLRGLLIKGRVSHVEGLPKFLEKIDKIG
jgi:5S rRNA maturation endonuclease (ribonuclease M5)